MGFARRKTVTSGAKARRGGDSFRDAEGSLPPAEAGGLPSDQGRALIQKHEISRSLGSRLQAKPISSTSASTLWESKPAHRRAKTGAIMSGAGAPRRVCGVEVAGRL